MGKTLPQEQIEQIIQLVRKGHSARSIASLVVLPYSTVAKYVRLFKVREGLPADLTNLPYVDFQPAPSQEVRNSPVGLFREALKVENQKLPCAPAPAPALSSLLPEAPKDMAEVDKRLNTMVANLTVGAERLLNSINSMSEGELATISLKERANALGTFIDKIRSIVAKNNPMEQLSGTSLNIVNIIASSVAPRKKDDSPDDYISVQSTEKAEKTKVVFLDDEAEDLLA